MQEQWTRWEPVIGLARKYDIDSISDNIEGFRVILSEYDDEKKKVHLIFKYSVDCHTRTNESYTFNLAYSLREQYGRDFYGDWTFFKVNNSDYLKRLSVISSTVSDEMDFTHFVVFGLDSMLDIIAKYEPEIEFVNLP